MCIAIYKPANKLIDDETLQTCYTNNPDGCGFAYISQTTGKLEIYKALKFNKWLKKYHAAQEEHGDSPFLIHFRIKTHGLVKTENCHPFRVDDHHVFIHNGTITKCAPDKRDGAKSDTRMFNELILRNLPEGWFHNDAIAELISPYIGTSKLAILNKDGEIRLINEALGTWEDGVWYSNTSYAPKKPVATVIYGGHHRGNSGPMTLGTGGTNTADPAEAARQLHKFVKTYPDATFAVQHWNSKVWYPAKYDEQQRTAVAYHFRYKRWVRWFYTSQMFDNYDEERAERAYKAETTDAYLPALQPEKNFSSVVNVMCDGCGTYIYYRDLGRFNTPDGHELDLCKSCEARYYASGTHITKLPAH